MFIFLILIVLMLMGGLLGKSNKEGIEVFGYTMFTVGICGLFISTIYDLFII